MKHEDNPTRPNSEQPNTITIEQVREMIKQEREQARDSVIDFVEGAIKGDVDRMDRSFAGLDYAGMYGHGWRRAFRRIAQAGRVPDQQPLRKGVPRCGA